jgi:hypothetical protein
MLLLCALSSLHAQYVPNQEDLLINDVLGSETNGITKERKSFIDDFYMDLHTYIPYYTNQVLTNPPETVIELSFHVFLDDTGGNNEYKNNQEGKARLLYLLGILNDLYSGNIYSHDIFAYRPGPSDPVSGVVELTNYDTRIRFTLGDSNERIYFYNNTGLNHDYSNASFENYIRTSYPSRATKLNIFFTAGYYYGQVETANIEIKESGQNYTSAPTITFYIDSTTTTTTATSITAEATAIITNGQLTNIIVTNKGRYSNFDPPKISITGGGGSGAVATVKKLAGGATGYIVNGPSSTNFSKTHHVVMLTCHEANDWIYGTTLAHELGHDIELEHTYAGEKCCRIINSVLTCDKDYLSDIFGPPGTTSTCPHIANWGDPYDNTIVNAEKITNNVMGGSSTQIYFSPMQAGQMHRTLALTSMRKYVKHGTYSPIPLEISQDETWADFNLKLYRDLIIKSGAVLTIEKGIEMPYLIRVKDNSTLIIKGTATFCKTAKIIVEPGSKLIVDGGTLTNSCDGELWQGIEVWGDTNNKQTNPYQGVVELKNGVVIENAICGIYVGQKVSPLRAQTVGGGGIVSATNAKFINNKQAIHFNPYSYNDSQYNMYPNNASYFINCYFSLDNNALFGSAEAAVAQVELQKVKGISFQYCNFSDYRTKNTIADFTQGIYANKSSVRVAKSPSIGIYDNGQCIFTGFSTAIYLLSSKESSAIYYTDFANNHVAVEAIGANNLTVKSCQFRIPYTIYSGNQKLVGILLDKSFGYQIENNTFAGMGGTGIYFNNTGESNHIIKNNTFIGLCIGCYVRGMNGEKSFPPYAQTGLQFQCNSYQSNDHSIYIDESSNIRYLQSQSNTAAGNLFSPRNNGNWDIYNRSWSAIDYFYDGSNPGSYPTYHSDHPALVKLTSVNSEVCIFHGAAGDEYYRLARLNPDFGQLEAAYQQAEIAFTRVKTTYKDMYGDSPIYPPMDGQQELYIQMTALKNTMDECCFSAITLIHEREYLDIAYYRIWLERVNTVESAYTLSSSYMATKEYDRAMEVVLTMPAKFEQIDLEAHEHYLRYLPIKVEYMQLGEGEVLSQPRIDELIELADNDDIAGIECESLLDVVRDYPRHHEQEMWFTNCIVQVMYSSQKSLQPSNPTETTTNLEQGKPILHLYPNPSKDVVYIVVENTTDVNIAQVKVYDIYGRLLRTTNNIGETQTEIDLSGLAAGIYYVRCSLDNGELKTKRIVKE